MNQKSSARELPQSVSQALKADSQPPTAIDTPVPSSPVVGGVPLYAFDKHTRLGKQAIRQFARENDAVRRCLEQHVADYRAQAAACVAAFYADAAPVSCRLTWEGSLPLEAMGTENDLLLEGVGEQGIMPLLRAVRDNLDHLNDIRARLLKAG
jgi:hypothetical protein